MDIVLRENESVKSFVKRANYIMTYVEPNKDGERQELEKKINFKPLSPKQISDIQNFWKDFLPNMNFVNLKWYEFYNSICDNEDDIVNYVPDYFYYKFVDEFYSNPFRSGWIDDKNLYDLIFHDIRMPKTICRKIGNTFLDIDYNVIKESDVIDMCRNHRDIVLKLPVLSCGGHGVKFVECDVLSDKEILDSFCDEMLFTMSARRRNEVICTEMIKQHKSLSSINESSCNTVRIITLVDENSNSTVLSSILRMGRNGSKVDNASSGGCFCGIDKNGITKDIAYDKTGKRYLMHPNGTSFANVDIPSFSKCVELAKKLSIRLSFASRMISWDFAIDENEEPILIEMNITNGELDFHQMCNGPIFGSNFHDIMNEIKENSVTLKNCL